MVEQARSGGVQSVARVLDLLKIVGAAGGEIDLSELAARSGLPLPHNQYGKAEIRVVRVFRDTEPHEIVDHDVGVALVGDCAAVHPTGDDAT